MKTRIARTHDQLLSICESLSQIADEYLPIAVTVENYKKHRSTQQNARLWEILSQISKKMPEHMDGEIHSPEMWMEYFKQEFLGKDVITIDGNPKIVHKSSSKLTTQEFNDFMTQIEAWAGDHMIDLELIE